MDNTKDHHMIVHTKNSAIGHFTVEITGPSITGRYVRGFGPKGDFKTGLSITTLDVSGMVRDDNKNDELDSNYMHSEPVAISRDQAERIKSFVGSVKDSPLDYDLNDYNCVDFANDMNKAAGLPGDVDTYLTKAQKEDMNGARFYNDFVYGGAERPSMVDPLVDHVTAFNRMVNGAKYSGLIGELMREGAPQSLLDELDSGLARQTQPEVGRANPSLGAAIMHGIEGHNLLSHTLPGGFSALEKIASVRAQNAYERTGSVVEAAQAAIDGVREAQNYNGPSSEFSPEDFMTPEENRAQLARNTKVLEARRASLLDGGAVSVKDAPAPTIHSTRAGAQKLYQQQVAALHPDPVTAARAVRATVPEQVSMPDFAAMFNDALDGLQSVLGVKAASAKEMTPARGGLESAKVAGLVMDQKVADKVMRTSAYAAKDPFAVDAVRSFYGATYADNDPGTPKRQSALDEPGRKSSVESLERKHARETQARYDAAYADIERENRQRAKEQASQDRQREAEAAAEAKRVRDTAAMEDIGATPGALATETVQVAKIDKLGDRAVSAAQTFKATLGLGGYGKAVADGAATHEDAIARMRAKAREDMVTIDQSQMEYASGDKARPSVNQRAGGAYKGPGTDWGTNADGSHKSSVNANGTSRGGVGIDTYGNEVGAYGQQTMDIVGRGDGSRAAGNTRVICTELVRQGRMTPSLQRLDIAFTLRELSPATVRGYHFWVVPYVRLMRRSKFVTACIEPIATWRALEIAYQLGERAQPHWRGKVVRAVMEPLCWCIGKTIEALPGDADRFHPGRLASSPTKTPTH